MRVVVVGLGNAGHTLHLPALAGLSNVQTVGAMDLDTERRTRAVATFKVPVYDDFDTMMRPRSRM